MDTVGRSQHLWAASSYGHQPGAGFALCLFHVSHPVPIPSPWLGVLDGCGPILDALCCPFPCPHVLRADTVFACLSLQENAIGDEGMAALAAALKVNTTLADLQ